MLKTYFTDDKTYSAEDFNTAISCLFSSGITGSSDGGNVIDSVNSVVSEAVSSGVDISFDESCRVLKTDGKYKINSGVCICPGGAILFIDGIYEPGTQPQPGNYVYVEHNVLHNTVEIVVSDTAGGESSVPLAKINADGTVEDRRVFASAKAGLTSANQYKQADSISVKYYMSYSIAVANCTEINVGFAGFKYVYIDADSADGHTELIDVSDCKEHQFGTSANGKTQYIKKQGSKLLVYGVRSNAERTYEKSFLIL